MPGPKRRILTEVELEIMQVVWASEEITAEGIVEVLAQQGRELTGGSVRKMLSILERKGYVTRRPSGRGKAFLYKAMVPQGKANRKMVLDLLKRAFGGSGALMVAALLETQAVNQKDIEKIGKLISKHRKEDQK